MRQASTTTKPPTPRFRFFNDIIAELKKVVWLSRREVAYLTVMVLIVCLAVGVVLGFIDYGFSKLVSSVFVGG